VIERRSRVRFSLNFNRRPRQFVDQILKGIAPGDLAPPGDWICRISGIEQIAKRGRLWPHLLKELQPFAEYTNEKKAGNHPAGSCQALRPAHHYWFGPHP